MAVPVSERNQVVGPEQPDGEGTRRTPVRIVDAAAYLGTNPRHVQELIRRRAIPYFKLGGLIRLDLDELDAWVSEHRYPVDQ